MRMVIRNKQTQKFFNGGEWVQKPEQAQSFRTVLEAAKAKEFYRLQDVEIYHMMLEQPSEFDFIMPL